MKFYKRVLKLHHFRNLGRNLPTELLLNSSFEKHGRLVILVGENNVGKSNVLEALKIFNDADVKLCSENDYFKAHESEDAVLSLEEETILDHKTIGFSCVDLKIQTKEVSEGLKELSKILISYPFEKHVEALSEQCSNSVYIPTNNNDYSNICTFVNNFINLIASYNLLESFLDFYKEKLKLSEFVTEYANATNNLFFKELIKHVSGNSEWIKNFCQCIKEIIKRNTPNKKYNTDEFFIMGKHKQNQLAKIYSYFKKLSASEVKPQNEDILKKLKSLDEIFKDSNTKFTPKIEVLQNKQSQERPSELIKDTIKEIDEKYPINENFKQQFRTFRLNIGNLKKKIKNSLKYLEKTREDFERKKERLIREIENDCKNQKVLEFNYDVLLDNIQQICKKYIASHVVNDASKDVKSMMCQFYLEKIELLSNSKIRRYQYDDLLKSARISLWESIKTLDNESGTPLFPKNIGEIKDKFEANKEKVKQSKNYFEFAEYCRECNPYTAFQGLRNKVQFPLSGGLSHKSYKLVPTMKEYKEPKITDNDFKAVLFTCIDYSSPSEFDQSDWFFRNSLFRKMDFHPNAIWNFFGSILKDGQALQIIMFDKNNDLVIYDSEKSFNIPEKYLQEIDQESLKEIRQSKHLFPIEVKRKYNNNVCQFEFFKKDTSHLLFKVNFTEILENLAEILEYNMQLKIDSLITKEFNRLLAIAQDSPQDSYQLKIHVRHNNKLSEEKEYTAYEIKLEVYDCRKSDNQKPIILSQQSTGFQWAFNFMFGFLYNVGSNFSFNKNIIYVMDEPATHLSVPARKEFRKFLKEYAHKNHVTFVLATHDPFLVDTDHLDEIRIVEKETEGSAIKNHFNYPLNNASKDSDALDKIKRSLGVGQHVFHNPQKHRIIFVEGITDYCYLSAFKLYFNKHNPQFKDNPIPFTFLPISGLKNNPNEMKETIQKLCELDNHPIVLTDDDRKCDSDQNATSERFKRANEDLGNPITILQLSDCDRHFKQIEDCFSANDRKKYAKNKRMELAMAFKTRLLYSGKDDVMSEETKNNFKKLFEWIKKECNNLTIKKEYIKFDYNTPQML
ncbi:ABC transporter ATPase [Helicobacter pylori X47-2AL]|uniref:ABC transporter ATPase n=1 Tax=Helicobacter pylori X47-2AL TaxID=1386083 RepID=V6LI25_HELPX|nr:AAA family ATPase [Helicobacter pylori]EST40489.1 ABC transporter ATPase [Helicobacter pylori X47-2AL]MUT41434.1 ATP-binding protein [Helicobacter pylori]MUT73614.1 ATP-binding protein [Helicobacter pylori]MUT81097.1 ATP-binding protein [Helicobacter pylori]